MEWSYFQHLVYWAVPVILLQWGIGFRIFLRNWKAILFPALLGGTFYSVIDSFAVRSGIWFFDPAQILNIHIGILPLEEVLFFYLTSLLVSQSFVLLLPARLRW